jgi:hypothetical protein
MTGAIHPRDFADTTLGNHSIKDRAEKSWWMLQGEFRHVAKALHGKRVFIELDTQTGYAAEGRIVGLGRSNSGYATPAVVIEFDHSDGTQRTKFPLTHVGVIIETECDGTGAKSVAFDTIRAERSAAIEQVKAAHPEADYGKWTADPMFREGEVTVRYTPQREGAGERLIEIVTVARETV